MLFVTASVLSQGDEIRCSGIHERTNELRIIELILTIQN